MYSWCPLRWGIGQGVNIVANNVQTFVYYRVAITYGKLWIVVVCEWEFVLFRRHVSHLGRTRLQLLYLVSNIFLQRLQYHRGLLHCHHCFMMFIVLLSALKQEFCNRSRNACKHGNIFFVGSCRRLGLIGMFNWHTSNGQLFTTTWGNVPMKQVLILTVEGRLLWTQEASEQSYSHHKAREYVLNILRKA